MDGEHHVAHQLTFRALERDLRRRTGAASLAGKPYGAWRGRLEKAGRPIGANDLLIAAQTLALDYTVVTEARTMSARIGSPRDGASERSGCPDRILVSTRGINDFDSTLLEAVKHVLRTNAQVLASV